MLKTAVLSLVSLGIAAPVLAQEAADPAALAEMMVGGCIFDDLDFDAEYAAMTEAMAGSGLPEVMVQDKTVMYGDPAAQLTLVGTRTIDSLSCTLQLPAGIGTHEVFTDFETRFETALQQHFGSLISQPDDDPSPHVDGHDWVASFPGRMHYAVTMNWGTEEGLLVAIGFRQLYE
ncbi:hypothetical protein [Pseudooceanicola sp.]|uniref:hypothetical protein n=1 Tax=Pseudooceanicola sp. TaxID=1914328 RepID=UPI0026093F84|nr:hypothetical protein [Pseudooceanicola sp.]MDF1856900.1 hypothetical protein [Pseudooceanicola sp.]